MFSGTQHKWLVLVAIAALAAFVIACGTDETKLVSDNGSGGVGAQPTVPADGDELPTDLGYEVVDELAPIESVQIIVMESYPEQFAVQIVSGIPSGCASFGHVDVAQDGTDIRISVYNSVPAPEQLAVMACLAIYGIHDENVSLGSNFERGTTYNVYVNDQPAETFTTGSSPTPGDALPPYADPGFEIVPAPVDAIEIVAGENGDGDTIYYGNVIVGLSNGCKEAIDPNVVRVNTTAFEVFPVLKVPTGDVMCTDDYRLTPVEVQFGVVGEELKACAVYSVIAGEVTETFQAIAPNVRCADPGSPTATPAPIGGGSIIADSHALQLTLEAAGFDVEFGGKSDAASLFGLVPTEMKINGQQVLIYEFAPGTSAEDASSAISSDGVSIKAGDTISAVNWSATPHFYLFGNAIVLYIGDDVEIGGLLETVLGGQFAGGNFGEVDESDEFTSRLATIEKVGVASTRSIPAQHLVGITVMLSSGCEEFKSIDWSVEGREVHIEVLTQVPSEPVPCILMIGYEDQSINIGSDFEAGVEYDVIVNGERQGTFIGG